jgi:hypothetical protein
MTTYYQALQRKSDQRYDYTSSTGSTQPHPIGYCAGWKEMSDYGTAAWDKNLKESLERDIEEKRPFKDKFHSDGHATAAEAEACYRQYELDHQLRLHEAPAEPDQLHRCKADGCKEFTAGVAFLGNHRHFYLCDAHRNRETVEKLITKKEVSE